MKTNALILIGSFHTGGSERQAVQLVSSLQKQEKYKIFVACLNREGVLLSEVERLGYIDFPEYKLTSFYDSNMFRQLKRCAAYLRENDIKIIQTTDFYTNVFGMLAGRLAKTPVRVAAKRETGTKTRAQRFLERRAFDLARAIVVNADAVKKYLAASGIAERKIHTIYNGLDFSRLAVSSEKTRAGILRELGLPAGENLKFVSIVANLRSRVKNHRMFLRAAKMVKENFADARFVIAGEGELLDETKDYAKHLGLEREVVFTGRAARVAALLSVSDVCVLSSLTEGFSNSILEYMAAAKPVVATDVGGAAEAIRDGETGFLVAPDDAETMAARIVELLENPSLAQTFGARAREIAEEKFSLSAQTEKTLDVYEKLLKVAN